MTLTCDTANKMIRRWTEEIDELQAGEELRKSYITSVDRRDMDRPDYDFVDVQTQIEDLNQKIMVVRHAVNVFNVTEVLPGCGFTIDQALVRMAHLNGQKMKLNEMSKALEVEKPKPTYGSSYGPNDYRFRNFDAKKSKKLCDMITEEILSIQQELNIVNVTKTFQVDI